jgi:hypothetical protein
VTIINVPASPMVIKSPHGEVGRNTRYSWVHGERSRAGEGARALVQPAASWRSDRVDSEARAVAVWLGPKTERPTDDRHRGDARGWEDGDGSATPDRPSYIRWAMPCWNGGLPQRWQPAQQRAVQSPVGYAPEQHGGYRPTRYAIESSNAPGADASQRHTHRRTSQRDQVSESEVGRRLSFSGTPGRLVHDDLSSAPRSLEATQ